MTTYYSPAGSRGHPTLTKGEGEVWMDATINLQDGAGTRDSATEVSIYLGCLLNNWSVTDMLGTEEIPQSCVNGTYTFPNDKNYKISVETRNLSPELIAAMSGMKSYVNAVSGQKVKIERKLTVTLAATETTIPLDTVEYLGTGVLLDGLKVLGLKQVSNGRWWSEVGTGDELNADYTYSFDGTNPDITFSAALDATLDFDFILTVQFERVMATGDWKLVEDGVSLPNGVDITLSWLRQIYTGPDKGKKGYLIAEAKNCIRTSDFVLGGDVKTSASSTLEFSVNFQDEGDYVLSMGVLE